MDLVLNEKVYQGHQRKKEAAREYFPVSYGFRIVGAQDKTADSPGECGHKVRYHKDVVPIVIICRGNICPTAACYSPK